MELYLHSSLRVRGVVLYEAEGSCRTASPLIPVGWRGARMVSSLYQIPVAFMFILRDR
jgi:hypothetical protein